MATSKKASSKSNASKKASKSKAGKSAKKSAKLARARTTRKAAEVTKPAPAKKSAKSPKAVRLTFSYDGSKVKLVSQDAVEMQVQPSDRIKDYYRQTGFWAETRNKDAKTLYRRVMHNPTRKDVEVFSDDPETGISRQPAPKRKGLFVVVLPQTDQVHEALVCQSRPQPKQVGSKGSKLAGRAAAVRPPQVLASVKFKK